MSVCEEIEEENFDDDLLQQSNSQNQIQKDNPNIKLTQSQQQQLALQKKRRIQAKKSQQLRNTIHNNSINQQAEQLNRAKMSREDRKIKETERLFQKMETNNEENCSDNVSESASGSVDQNSLSQKLDDLNNYLIQNLNQGDGGGTSLFNQIQQNSDKSSSEFQLQNNNNGGMAIENQKKRSDIDPVNQNYAFGEQSGIFFYLYDYQEREKQKLQDMDDEKPKKFSIQIKNQQSNYGIIKVNKVLIDETLLVQNKILKKFNEYKKELSNPFSKEQKEFCDQFINKTNILDILKPHKIQKEQVKGIQQLDY